MPDTPSSAAPKPAGDPQAGDLLANLRSPVAGIRRATAEALAGQTPLTPQLLAALEQLAVYDPDPGVRLAALAVLDSLPARRLRAAQAIPLSQRVEILEQIERWRAAGRLTHAQAGALRLRYTFDMAPLRLSPGAWNALYNQVGAWQAAGLVGAEQAGNLRADLQGMNRPPGEKLPPAQPVPSAAGEGSTLPVEGVLDGLPVSPAYPLPQPPVSETARPAESPFPQQPPQPAPASRQSLQEILFSEVSIRIALFLGGFLIVAAALILAAVLEFARLPILLGVTALTGAAALLVRRRLALPSFVLLIIFASLLLIDAGVAADLLGLDDNSLINPTLNGYWAVVMAVEGLVLAAATHVYRSRLFSLAALLALDTAAFNLAIWLGDRFEYHLFLWTMVGLASTAWQVLMKQHLELRFVWPLHWVTHLQGVVLAATMGITTLLYFLFTYEPSLAENVEPFRRLLLGAAWLAVFAFYLLNDLRVKSFVLLPFAAAAAALFAPWILVSALRVSDPWVAGGVAAAGILTALAGNYLALRKQETQDSQPSPLRRYGAPLLAASTGLMLWAALIGWLKDLPTAFGVLLAAGVLFTALHAQKTRFGLWLAALLAWTAAFFTFFQLDFARAWNVDLAYQLTGAGLLLLLPDLLIRRPGASTETHWLVPARLLGAILIAANTFWQLILVWLIAGEFAGDGSEILRRTAAWVFSITGLFLLVYALRRARWVIYAAAGFLFAGLACWLAYFEQREFMMPLAYLAAAFYLAGLGLLLSRRQLEWAAALRYSGLALSTALVLFLPFEPEKQLGPGLALLLGGVFFLVEIHIRRGGWLEIPMLALVVVAYMLLLRVFAAGPAFPRGSLPGYDLFGASLLMLGADLYFTRRAWQQSTQEIQRIGVRALGGVLAAACALFWVVSPRLPASIPAVLLALYTLFFLFLSWGHQQPLLGYPAFAALAGCLFYTARAAGAETWLAPEILLAAALYGSSFLLGRLAGRFWWAGPAWTQVRRLSGLLLAMLVSLTAPLEDSGLWASVWVAVAATLYAIEAFRLHNVWLGFPANGLYLLAYFILLFELEVREPQFFSVGVAVLGLLMHYLLVRSGSRLGAFLTGLVSQLVLLGTTYIQMVSTNRLSFFVMLFFQGLVVLAYGIIIRSRSLVLAPVIFIVLGVISVVLSVLSGVPTAIIIGCTGVLLLAAGILALLMRERLAEFSDRFGSWRA